MMFTARKLSSTLLGGREKLKVSFFLLLILHFFTSFIHVGEALPCQSDSDCPICNECDLNHSLCVSVKYYTDPNDDCGEFCNVKMVCNSQQQCILPRKYDCECNEEYGICIGSSPALSSRDAFDAKDRARIKPIVETQERENIIGTTNENSPPIQSYEQEISLSSPSIASSYDEDDPNRDLPEAPSSLSTSKQLVLVSVGILLVLIVAGALLRRHIFNSDRQHLQSTDTHTTHSSSSRPRRRRRRKKSSRRSEYIENDQRYLSLSETSSSSSSSRQAKTTYSSSSSNRSSSRRDFRNHRTQPSLQFKQKYSSHTRKDRALQAPRSSREDYERDEEEQTDTEILIQTGEDEEYTSFSD